MWSSHNLTSRTNRSSYEVPAGYKKKRVVVTKVMARRIQDQRVLITMACMWSLVGSDTQGMQSEI